MWNETWKHEWKIGCPVKEDSVVTKGISNGLIGGAVASLCCLGPTIITIFGIGALLGISGVCYAQYRLQFLLAGLFFIGIGTFLYFKKGKNKCELQTKRKTAYVGVSLISMSVTYTLIIYFLVPFLQSSINSGFCSIS